MTINKSDLRLPACLIIMDGFGLDAPSEGNAITTAKTPNLDKVFADNSWIKLQASGEAVGLPEGQMGNSEVGHLNIGAGRVVHQELTRINRACKDGSIATNPIIRHAFDTVIDNGSKLHMMGLLSDGGVHSTNGHLYALIQAAVNEGVKKIRVHCFMDGRDVPPTSGAGYVRDLEKHIEEIVKGASNSDELDISIATIQGRYYAMDRDNRWDRVERAYDNMVSAANKTDLSPVSAMDASYEDDVTDEFIVPVSFDEDGINDGDAVIFFNFRPDRAREITRAFVDEDFKGFERKKRVHVEFVCLTEYDPTIDAPIAFPKEFPDNVLADVLAKDGLSQYHIAETEKYAHVTFFLNGGIEEPKKGEVRKLIASPKVATYDLQPEMSEPEVASTLASAIRADEADVYIVNFANCDMVGHTGSIPAAIAAVEAVDSGVGEVLEALSEKNGVCLLTADHGNADKMVAPDGSPHTAHTTAKVPLVLIDYSRSSLSLKSTEGKLADIAPTLLHIIGVEVPAQMTGDSLLDS